MTLANRFGWSLSREALLDECPRRYYFHYYLSWGGWRRDAPLIVRDAFALKRLTSIHLWRGQLVHYIASKVLQSFRVKGRIPDKEAVVAYTMDLFDRQLAFSAAKRYRAEPKKTGDRINIEWLALFEHEYARPLEKRVIDALRGECRAGIDGLFACPILADIAETDRAGWIIEDLDGGAFAEEFPFRGATVYVKTDFRYRAADGATVIVDWKTNRPGDPMDAADGEGAPENAPAGAEAPGSAKAPAGAAVQLGIYAFYASEILGVPPDRLRLREVNLLAGGRVIEHAVDEGTLDASSRRIAEGISTLASLLMHRDTARNEPLPADRFPKIENGRCRFCNFLRICKDPAYPATLP